MRAPVIIVPAWRARVGRSARTRDTALARLVRRCADQDPAALELLYQSTSPWIHHLIQQKTPSRSDVDDTLVAVYTAVWNRAPGFDRLNRTALAWATSIAFEIMNAANPESAIVTP